MTPKERYFTMYASVVQGILEAKLGIAGEAAPQLLAEEAIRVTDAVMDRFDKKFAEENDNRPE